MTNTKLAEAEKKAHDIAAAPLKALNNDFVITNCSGRFNSNDYVSIRVAKGREIDTPDIMLKIWKDRIELGSNFTKSANGSVIQSKKRKWKSVSEKTSDALGRLRRSRRQSCRRSRRHATAR